MPKIGAALKGFDFRVSGTFRRIIDHLGSGQFGTVNRGEWESPDGTVEVAVKMLKAGSAQSDRVKFLQEAAIMGQFQHHNVVQLYGVVTIGEPVSQLANLDSQGCDARSVPLVVQHRIDCYNTQQIACIHTLCTIL